MEPAIREQYNPAILEQAAARYGLDPGSLEELDGFESFIFKARQGGVPRILRIGHSLRRTEAHVLGEADFINYLSDHGLSVPRVVPSRRGELVEPIPAADNGRFIAALFEYAPGRPPRKEDRTPKLHEAMGRYMGEMHRLSKRYRPTRRHRFSILDDSPEFLETFLPVDEIALRQKAGELTAHLRSLPIDDECYGLIHVDFHFLNFFVEDDAITLFDFDDCQYSWYAHDIAMSLFYALPHDCSRPDDLARGHDFLRSFLRGYRAVTPIEACWLQEIPTFLKLREFELYAAIHRSLDLDQLDPWCASFMAGRRRKLEDGVPYFDLHLEKI